MADNNNNNNKQQSDKEKLTAKKTKNTKLQQQQSATEKEKSLQSGAAAASGSSLPAIEKPKPSPSQTSAAVVGTAAKRKVSVRKPIPRKRQTSESSLEHKQLPPRKLLKQSEENTKVNEVNATPGPSTSTQAEEEDKDKEEDKDAKKKKNRCAECRKKVGLTGFQCRCGGLYCAVHRYSDKHNCTFNYKEHGAQEIRRNNPVVVGEKIQKI